MSLPYELKRTAYHEAGHLIVAAVLGFETHEIRITPKGAGEAVTSVQIPGVDPLDYAARRIAVLLAGVVGQCLVLHPGDVACAKAALERENGLHDWMRAEELARLVAQARVPSAVTPQDFKAAADAVVAEEMARAQRILEDQAATLRAIGQLVLDKFDEILSDPDVEGVVEADQIAALLQGATS